MIWEELTQEERDMYNGVAESLNNSGKGKEVLKIKALLDNDVLTHKDGKLLINGEFALKMETEQGINHELLPKMINEILK